MAGIFGEATAPFQSRQAIVSVDITVLAKGTSTSSGLYRLCVCHVVCDGAYQISYRLSGCCFGGLRDVYLHASQAS